MKPIIEIKNVSKKYRIGSRQPYLTFRDSFISLLNKPFTKDNLNSSTANKEFWALKNISFNVNEGDVVGVVGRNGAGKSTLLKILSRITPPTRGEIIMRGRVASLLEVGTGFHPELTGKENIFLNGAILGMSQKEIRKNYDEIVDFSEIGRFIDTPVKFYSSGMYMRLAFSVAAHLQPEILIVDEVLSVGDIDFQKKCIGKMDSISKHGRTIIFVSHNISAILMICTKALLLSEGQISSIGGTDDIVDIYQTKMDMQKKMSLTNRKDRTGSGMVRISSLYIRDLQGNKIENIKICETIEFVLCANIKSEVVNKKVSVNLIIIDKNDYRILSLQSDIVGASLSISEKNMRFVCRVDDGLNLIPGKYKIIFSILINGILADKVISAAEFNIIAADYYRTGQLPDASMGPILIKNSWYKEMI